MLDSATCMGKDLQAQEEINDKNDDDEPVEEIVSTVVATLEKSVASSSASTKRKRKTKPAKASPKPPPVLEKKSVHKNYDKKDDQIEKNPKRKRTSKCPHVGMHQKRELTGLSEEQIVANLEKGYLRGAHCSVCKKIIVNKKKLTTQESATKTMFSMKRLLFTCDNYSAANDINCTFCMCRQCFVDVSINDKNDTNPEARKSRRRN